MGCHPHPSVVELAHALCYGVSHELDRRQVLNASQYHIGVAVSCSWRRKGHEALRRDPVNGVMDSIMGTQQTHGFTI